MVVERRNGKTTDVVNEGFGSDMGAWLQWTKDKNRVREHPMA